MRGGAAGWVHLRMTAPAGISVFGRKRQVLGRTLACGAILVLSDHFPLRGRGYIHNVDASPCSPRQLQYATRPTQCPFTAAPSRVSRGVTLHDPVLWGGIQRLTP